MQVVYATNFTASHLPSETRIYAKRRQKNTMQLLKISSIICSFILAVDVVVKPVLAKAGDGRQRTVQSKKRIYK
jgi:hypothetical protein